MQVGLHAQSDHDLWFAVHKKGINYLYKKPDSARVYLEEGMAFAKTKFNKYDWQYGYACYYLALAYHDVKLYDQFEKYGALWETSYEVCYGLRNKHEKQATYLSFRGLARQRSYQYDSALYYYDQALQFIYAQKLEDNYAFEVCASNSGVIAEKMGYYDLAFKMNHANSAFCAKKYGLESTDYLNSRSREGSTLTKLDRHREAANLLSANVVLAGKILGTNHSAYPTHLSNAGVAYIDLGLYDSAIFLLNEAKVLQEKISKYKGTYSNILNNIALAYDKDGQLQISLEHYLEALRYDAMIYGRKSNSYGVTANNISNLYEQMGQYDLSIKYGTIAVEIAEKTLRKNHPSYGLRLGNLAQTYGVLGNYSKAISLYRMAMAVDSANAMENSVSHGRKLNGLALLYSNKGESERSIEMYEKARTIFSSKLGAAHPNLLLVNGNLATVYADLGQYQKALEIQTTLLSKYKATRGTKSLEYARTLNHIGVIHDQSGRPYRALPFVEESLEIARQVYGESHPIYANRLNNLGKLYASTGSHQKAIPLFKKSIQLAKKKLGAEHSDYALRVNNLAEAYVEVGQYNLGLGLYRESAEVFQKVYGSEHEHYIGVLVNMGAAYMLMRQYDSMEQYFIRANEKLVGQLQKVISFQGEKQQQEYLDRLDYHFELFQSALYQNPEASVGFVNMNFQNQLILKGLLLRKNRSIMDDLEQLNMGFVTAKINELRNIRVHINRQEAVSTFKFGKSRTIDSLKKREEILEAYLIKLHRSKFGNTLSTEYSIDSLLTRCGGNEALIEFSSFDYFNGRSWTDTTFYACYLLKKGMQGPKFTRLCTEKELMTVLGGSSPQRLYKFRGAKAKQIGNVSFSDSLSGFIWAPFSDLLSNTNRIQFTTTGLLNQISFAALVVDSTVLCQKFDLIQKRNLADESEPIGRPQNILLTGGVEYNMSGSRSTNSGVWSYLPGTEAEVASIDHLLSAYDVKRTTLTGLNASERSFKSLNGSNYDVLHISTHGFFFEDPYRNRARNASTAYALAKDPMVRSGLILAGANHNWSNAVITRDQNDGILTALEISNMNLTHTKLVILSACETGLGDVQGTEGVYGLQRAFKQAGVDKLIMSLWQVPDAETKEFMEILYADWMAIGSLQTAFQSTQRKMQAKYPTDPLKWAAFVLME